jgi:transcriptional regulator with PAS, ATPase and Fis domain
LIENKTFFRIGDTKENTADVRIIAASNKSCVKLVDERQLRRDLYERFIRTIRIPTLKERIEDFDYFVDRFIAEENKAQGKTVTISKEARDMLARYDWTGNIRQLKNVVETLVIEVEPDKLSGKYVIKRQLVRERLNEYEQNGFDDLQEDDYTLKTAYNVAGEKAMRRALNKTGGDNEQAIKLLNISRGTYYSLKKKSGI